MAIDTNTPTGQVRLLTADLNEADFMVNDDLITGYLTLNTGNVRRAAADVLDAMATSEVLLSKKIRTQAGLSTDGPAVAAELRKQAAALRGRAAEEDAALLAGEGFDVINFLPYGQPGHELEERRL